MNKQFQNRRKIIKQIFQFEKQNGKKFNGKIIYGSIGVNLSEKKIKFNQSREYVTIIFFHIIYSGNPLWESR